MAQEVASVLSGPSDALSLLLFAHLFFFSCLTWRKQLQRQIVFSLFVLCCPTQPQLTSLDLLSSAFRCTAVEVHSSCSIFHASILVDSIFISHLCSLRC